MTDQKQICVHFLSGNCKYGITCTKIHVFPSAELLEEIEKKGPIICNFHPNCKFSSLECKKIHINNELNSEKEINELKKIYLKIINYDTNDIIKNKQIERVKFMIKNDLEMIKDTWNCLSE